MVGKWVMERRCLNGLLPELCVRSDVFVSPASFQHPYIYIFSWHRGEEEENPGQRE